MKNDEKQFLEYIGFSSMSKAILNLGYETYMNKRNEFNKEKKSKIVNNVIENDINLFVKAKLKDKSRSDIYVNKLGQVKGASGNIIKGRIASEGISKVRKIEYTAIDGKIKSESIARIVWRTFLGTIPDNHFILPIKNLLEVPYCLSNLQCISPSENMLKSHVRRKTKENYTYKNSNKNTFIFSLSNEQRKELENDIYKSNMTLKEISTKWNVNKCTISTLKRNIANNNITL